MELDRYDRHILELLQQDGRISNQADGLHPNPQGIAIVVERIMPAVVALIAQAEEKRAKGK